jgi:hypothetical protein
MTKDEMIDRFKSAPNDSRHQRMLWAAREIAHLNWSYRRWCVSDAVECPD